MNRNGVTSDILGISFMTQVGMHKFNCCREFGLYMGACVVFEIIKTEELEDLKHL